MKRFLRLAPALGWMVLIFYLSSIQDLELKGALSIFDLVLRKAAHITEYFILFCLLNWGLKRLSSKKNILISAFISVFYAITDEIHQSFVPTREGKPLDVFIDSLGILGGIILVKYFHAYNKQKSSRNPEDRVSIS